LDRHECQRHEEEPLREYRRLVLDVNVATAAGKLERTGASPRESMALMFVA